MSNVGLCAAMMKRSMSLAGVLLVAVRARGGPVWPGCAGCHNQTKAMGGLDLSALPFHLTNRATRERWIRIHDRVQKGEMPPKGATFPAAQRAAMVKRLAASIHGADQAEIARQDHARSGGCGDVSGGGWLL